MIIVFKLIGAFAGIKIAIYTGNHPLSGLIVGAILGHSIDIVVSTKINRLKAQRYWRAQANIQYQQVFMTTVFPMLGKICAADGQINPTEVETVERIINEVLKLKRRDKKEALRLFRNAMNSPTSFQFDAAQYFEIHQGDSGSLENFLCVLFQVALSDGKLSEGEEKLIRSAAVVFNIGEQRYGEIRASFLGSRGSTNGSSASASLGLNGHDPYAVLGCKPSDSVAVIKQHYRKLVSDYHPDKIVSKNLPEDFTRFASEKFKTIQEAYEAVKSERKFS